MPQPRYRHRLSAVVSTRVGESARLVGVAALSILVLAPFRAAAETPITIEVEATVTYVSDYGDNGGRLAGRVQIGDSVTGRYAYDLDVADSNSHPNVGDYEYTTAPYGIALEVGSLTFQSDPTTPYFLMEMVNDYGDDNYLLRSYVNSPLADGTLVEHISWQLDDDSMTALSSVDLPATPPDLSAWTYSWGLRIEGQSDWSDPEYYEYFIQADVTAVRIATTLDHFLCYKTSARDDVSMTLADALDTGVYSGSVAKSFCLPADDDGEGIADEATHLQSYKVTGPHTPRTGVLVANEFGRYFVDTKKTDAVMVPTGASLAPAAPPSVPDSKVEHFRCLKAKPTKGMPKFPKGTVASVVDQLATHAVVVTKPSRLCVPTDENGDGLYDDRHHLVCYKIKASTPTSATGVQVANQLGSDTLAIQREGELCVPSLASASCGNGAVDADIEDCDGIDFDGASCAQLGDFSGGTPTCTPTCEIDTASCSICGNGEAEPGEACDGADDAACPGLCTSICACPVLSPVTEDLQPCTTSDSWVFDVATGDVVAAHADTTGAATAADLAFSITCTTGDEGWGDDDVVCTFPPPSYSCPQTTFAVTGNGTCTVYVEGLGSCVTSSLAEYELRVTRNGADALMTLVDDN